MGWKHLSTASLEGVKNRSRDFGAILWHYSELVDKKLIHALSALWFSPPALKNYATRSFLIFFLCMKNKKEWPNLCSMRLERAMLSYIWVYHGCCEKSRKNVIFVLKRMKNFFPVGKGCFWCKMMRGIQKSWSQSSRVPTFWDIGRLKWLCWPPKWAKWAKMTIRGRKSIKPIKIAK